MLPLLLVTLSCPSFRRGAAYKTDRKLRRILFPPAIRVEQPVDLQSIADLRRRFSRDCRRDAWRWHPKRTRTTHSGALHHGAASAPHLSPSQTPHVIYGNGKSPAAVLRALLTSSREWSGSFVSLWRRLYPTKVVASLCMMSDNSDQLAL